MSEQERAKRPRTSELNDWATYSVRLENEAAALESDNARLRRELEETKAALRAVVASIEDADHTYEWMAYEMVGIARAALRESV